MAAARGRPGWPDTVTLLLTGAVSGRFVGWAEVVAGTGTLRPSLTLADPPLFVGTKRLFGAILLPWGAPRGGELGQCLLA